MQVIKTTQGGDYTFKEDIITTGGIIPPPPSNQPQDLGTEQKERGYNVYMYEEGKRVKANKTTLPKREAERLGRDIADNSLSASFKVSQTRERVPSSRRSRLATGGYSSPSKFTESRSKSRRGFFIEKKTHRLDSQGEQRGIKASKLIAERRRASFGNSKKRKGWRL